MLTRQRYIHRATLRRIRLRLGRALLWSVNGLSKRAAVLQYRSQWWASRNLFCVNLHLQLRIELVFELWCRTSEFHRKYIQESLYCGVPCRHPPPRDCRPAREAWVSIHPAVSLPAQGVDAGIFSTAIRAVGLPLQCPAVIAVLIAQ
jgi:hypothetical protein